MSLLLLFQGAGGGTDVTVTPGIDTLVLTGLAPTVTATSNVTVTPAIDTLVLTGLAPTVSVTSNPTVTPGVGSLVITGYEPEISTGRGGGADGPIPRRKKKRRIIEAPPPPRSVEEQVEEFLASRKAKPLSKKATAKEIIKDLTTAEKEAMRNWAEQQEVDAEDEEIVMLLMAL